MPKYFFLLLLNSTPPSRSEFNVHIKCVSGRPFLLLHELDDLLGDDDYDDGDSVDEVTTIFSDNDD